MDGAGKQRPVSLTENQFVLLRSDTDPKKTMLGRFYGEKVTALRFGSVRPFGVKPRSVGQKFLQETLLLPAEEVPLAIIQGPAGTAKTFYALAAGLEQVLETEERPYRKILVCRPNAQFDADIGFLPGSEQEKISPSCGPLWTIWKFCWIWRGRKRSGISPKSLVVCAVGFVCAIVAELTATAGMSLIDWEAEWAESGTAMAVGMIVAAAVAIIALLVIKKNAEKRLR